MLPYFLLLLTMLLWGSAFTGIKLVLEQVDPFTLTMLRLLFASAGVLVAGYILRIPWPERRDLPKLAAIGLLGFSLYHGLLNLGMNDPAVSAGQGAFLVSTIPIWTTLLARPYLGESISMYGWLGMALGLAGVAVMSLNPDKLTVSTGSFIVVAAAGSAAGNIVLQKKLLERYEPLHLAIYVTVIGSLPVLAYLPWGLPTAAGMDTTGWLAAAYLGLVPIALGYFLNAWALSLLPANRSSQFLLLVPINATLLHWLAPWGAPPDWALMYGGPLILAGVALGQYSKAEEARTREA